MPRARRGRGAWIDQPTAPSASSPVAGRGRRARAVGHPARRLPARPRPAVRRGRGQTLAEPLQELGLEHGGDARVAAAQVARRRRASCVVPGGPGLLDPTRREARRLRHPRDRVALRQQPDHLEVSRRPRVVRRPEPRLQPLLHAQVIDDPRHRSPPLPTGPDPSRFAPAREPRPGPIARKPYQTGLRWSEPRTHLGAVSAEPFNASQSAAVLPTFTRAAASRTVSPDAMCARARASLSGVTSGLRPPFRPARRP